MLRCFRPLERPLKLRDLDRLREDLSFDQARRFELLCDLDFERDDHRVDDRDFRSVETSFVFDLVLERDRERERPLLEREYDRDRDRDRERDLDLDLVRERRPRECDL